MCLAIIKRPKFTVLPLPSKLETAGHRRVRMQYVVCKAACFICSSYEPSVTQLEPPLCFYHLCLTRRRRFWDAEQEQPLWEKPSGAAGPLHPLCCFLSDFSQHCQRRPDSPRGWNGSAVLHHTQVKTANTFRG